jgi:thioredoxin-related protein
MFVLYWKEEVAYTLPTPVPQHYQEVPVQTTVVMHDILSETSFDKPLFLHFFSAECACSRFNIDHFQSLVKKYRDSVEIYVVLQAKKEEAQEAIRNFQHRYALEVPVIVDEDEKLAKKCGVYSTPQAVMLDTQGRIYYRGNYNQLRFCTVRKSNYAQFALDSLLANAAPPDFGEAATRSYGCALPSHKENNTSWINFDF